MASSTFVQDRPTLLSQLIDWQDRLRVRWNRRLARHKRQCPICNSPLEQQADDLLAQGFYRAAITTCRLRLELVAVEYYDYIVKQSETTSTPLKRISFRWIVNQLEDLEEIDEIAAARLRRIYARSSRVTHGGAASRGLARLIVADTKEVAALLKGGAA